MSDKLEKAGWKYWGLWVGASTVGWLFGMAASLFGAFISALVVAFLGGSLRMDEFAGSGRFGTVEEVVISGVAGVIAGAMLGTSQWIILQRRTSLPGWWVLASALGGAAGWVLVEVVNLGTSPTTTDVPRFGPEGGVMAGAIIGALIGTAQWLVLRRQLSHAGWWVPASVVGWAAGWAVFRVVVGVGTFVVPGVLGGAITGAALVWLLRRQRDG